MTGQAKRQLGPFDLAHAGSALIVAEAGVNHNGDLGLAKRLVGAAKAAGADCIKFQTFRADRVATRSAPKAAYQLRATDADQSQLDMLRNLELSEQDYRQLVRVCEDEQISFLSTPYDVEDVDFLQSLGVAAFKIASGQAVEPVLLEHVARKGKPILLSTGMCTLAEVQRAVRTIHEAGNQQVVVMQCTTAYPTAVSDANLLAMVTMRQRLGVLVGYSDHTTSLIAAAVAVGLGACVIERHLTLDRTLPGPDQACSVNPEGFAAWVGVIREAERSLGSPVKQPTAAEKRNMAAIRRGVVARLRIPAGARLTLQNLTVKRPASQFTGDDLPRLLGRVASVDIDPDTQITPEMIR